MHSQKLQVLRTAWLVTLRQVWRSERFRRHWQIGIVITTGLLLAGCSALSSDTVRIVQSNADGTITAMNATTTSMQSTLDVLQPTLQQAAIEHSDLSTYLAQNAQMITTLNAIQTTVPPQQQAAPQVAPSAPQTGNSGGTAPQSGATAAATSPDPNTLVIDPPVMAKGIDGQGCAIKPVTTFMMTDSKIYIIAKVHKLVKGTVFTAAWSGSVTHSDTWTADRNAASLCVHFYVDPTAINMAPGQWTVSLSVPSQPPQSVAFSIADTAATAAATP